MYKYKVFTSPLFIYILRKDLDTIPCKQHYQILEQYHEFVISIVSNKKSNNKIRFSIFSVFVKRVYSSIDLKLLQLSRNLYDTDGRLFLAFYM